MAEFNATVLSAIGVFTLKTPIVKFADYLFVAEKESPIPMESILLELAIVPGLSKEIRKSRLGHPA